MRSRTGEHGVPMLGAQLWTPPCEGISHLSRMKNPGLPYPSIAAALRAYGYVLSSLDDSNSLGTTASFTRTYSPCLNLIAVLLFPISWPSPVCYLLFDYCHIRYASPPLRPIEGVRGIHL